jgi:hypothetical protein
MPSSSSHYLLVYCHLNRTPKARCKPAKALMMMMMMMVRDAPLSGAGDADEAAEAADAVEGVPLGSPAIDEARCQRTPLPFPGSPPVTRGAQTI